MTPAGLAEHHRYADPDTRRAAWRAAGRAAGLTASEMMAMPWNTPWTEQRHAVERDTNELAAAPYAVLAPEPRLTLLAYLATLP